MRHDPPLKRASRRVKVNSTRSSRGFATSIKKRPRTVSSWKDCIPTQITQITFIMALLVDKLRPRSLDSLSYHTELSERLRSLVRTDTARGEYIDYTVLWLTGIWWWILGTKRRFPSPSSIWTVWCRQEDQDYRDTQGTVWPWCWEDQDRRPSLPNVE